MFVQYITTMLVHYNKLFHSPWGTKKLKEKKKCRKNIQCKKNSKLKKSDFSIVFLLSRIKFRYHHISHLCIFYFFKPLSNVWMYISPYDEPKNIELFSQKIIFLCIQLHTRCKAYCSIFMQMISIYSYILLTPVA